MEQLWRARAWVLCVAGAVMAAATIYAFAAAPVVYETRVMLLPPRPAALTIHTYAHLTSAVAYPEAQRSIDASGRPEEDLAIPLLTPDQAYDVFLRHLGSAQLRSKFFQAHYLQSAASAQRSSVSLADQWAALNESIELKMPSAASQQAVLTWRGQDAEQIAVWANQFVDMAIDSARHQLRDDLVSELTMRLTSVQAQADVSRQVGRIQRGAQIERTQEAWQLARAVGLEEVDEAAAVLVIDDTPALSYLQGSKALQAQLELLRARQTDDPYIAALTQLRRTQLLLSSVQVNAGELGVVRVDAAAVAPQRPVAPQRLLIIVMGAILGLILGCVAAWARTQLRREPEASERNLDTAM